MSMTATPPFVDCTAVAEGLRHRRPEWLPQIFPAGVIEGSVFYIGDPDGTPGRSMPIPLDGAQPILCDFASDFSGDDLDLYARATSSDLATARRDAAARLGYGDESWEARKPDEELLKARRAKIELRRRQSIARAQNVWGRAVPADGTLAETYARERAFKDEMPASHGFVAELHHKDSDQQFPALVTTVTDIRNEDIIGIHRIYLDAKTGWKVRFGDRKMSPKMSMGHVKEGSIHIGGEGGALMIVEGIENAWSIWDALGDRGTVRAVVGASMFRSQILPKRSDYDDHLVIAADSDEAGIKGAEALRDRAVALGWSVRLMFPPKGTDFNCLAMREAGHE